MMALITSGCGFNQGTGISGAVTVSAVSGTALVLSSAQTIADT